MSFNSHIPFHRQISGTLVFLFTSIIVVVGIISFLFYQRNIQVNQLVNTQIPKVEYIYQYQQLLLLNDNYILALKKNALAKDLNDTLAKFKRNIEVISTLSYINVRKVKFLLAEIESIEKVAERIDSNDARNITLKNTAVVQLRLLVSTLIEQINTKIELQSQLNNKINLNGRGGYISAEHAIEYIENSKILVLLNKSLNLLDGSILGFESLSIVYSVSHFEEITHNIDLAVSTWLSVLTTSPEDMVIRSKIEDLQSLFNVEQRVVAKWYSHLRLAEEVLNRMVSVNEKLNTQYIQDKRRIHLSTPNIIIPDFITQIVNETPYTLSTKNYYYALSALVAFSLLVILFILFRLRIRIKHYGANTVNLCENILAGDERKQDEYVKTSEQLRIVGLIQQIQKPEHKEPQLLLKSYQRNFSFIAKNHQIAVWQYQPFSSYIEISEQLLIEIDPTVSQTKNWRQLITPQALSTIIIAAKAARNSQITQYCQITTKSNILLELYIGFNGTQWFGTISKNAKVGHLKNNLDSLKEKLNKLEQQSNVNLAVTTEKFSKMVLWAMLQTQGNSVDINPSSLAVYRQLTRIFDWCNQSHKIRELQQNICHSKPEDITFNDELHAIIFNAMPEAHLQRNRIYLQTDKLLSRTSSIDHQLFHSMLLSVIRVVLAELFNAKMLINLKVIDRDAESQTVQFTLTVQASKKLKGFPRLVKRLINEEPQSATKLDIIFYIKILMQHFNIDHCQSELTDNGFNVMFTLQLNEIKSSLTDINTLTENLDQYNIVLLSNCSYLQKTIAHCINSAGGEVATVNNINDFTEEYSPTSFIVNPVELVIVGDDITRSQREILKIHLNSFAKNIKPKMFFMQSPITSSYHKEGLYNQASMPLCSNSFLSKLLKLLKNEQPDNLLIDAELLNPYQYLATRVEVLLAVSVPEDHQLLIRILQWLGLQVHVVSQPSAMLKNWQSGRYLILITEFAQSPFISLFTGQKIQRAVFTLNDNLCEMPVDDTLSFIKQWKVSRLPNILDIKALVILLSPWLKSKTSFSTVKSKKTILQDKLEQSFDGFLSQTSKLEDIDKAYLTYSQAVLPQEYELPPSHVLDMEKYAINQGSSELAAFMIDEYINDIALSINLIDKAIQKHAFDEAVKPLQVILKVSGVMAANNIYMTSQLLQRVIEQNIKGNNNAKTDLNVNGLANHLTENGTQIDDLNDVNKIISELRDHLAQLTKFTDAI